MAFVRWDPLRDLLAIQQRLNRGAPAPSDWTPAVDLHETDACYVITAEVPGMGQASIDVRLDGGHLTLSGVRRPRTVTAEEYQRIERGHGTFSRTFHLPHPVDADRITADLRDGVLTVTCPKTADTSTRRIDIG